MLSALLALAFAQEAPVDPANDPLLWLEEVTGERPLAWVRERNTQSEGEIMAVPGAKELEGRILSILDSDAKIPFVTKLGKHYYNFWKDGEHPRGVWRRTTLAEYQKADPAWELVLDVDALNKAEGASFVWKGADCLPPAYDRCLLMLSPGGGDSKIVREFDTKKKAFVEGGFTLPEAKSDVAWIDRDTLFVGTDFGEGSLTSSGYPRIQKTWSRGTPLSSATVAYEVQPTDVWGGAWRDHTKGFERTFYMRAMDFYTNEKFYLQDGKPVRLDKPDSAEAQVWREWVYVSLREDWAVGGKTYKAGSLLAENFDAFLAGDRSFDVLFEPTERTSLDSYTVTRHHVVLDLLDNVRSRVEVLTPGKTGWARSSLSGLPAIGSISVESVDAETSDDLWVTLSDYITPTTLSITSPKAKAPTRLKAMPAMFDANGLEITQHEATSKDGTKVPYFLVGRKGMALDGSHPTLLYGYGGFEVSLTPGYSGGIGAAWLEQGNVYVVANIRGGGEFGPRWHQAALRENRNKAYEDFASVAEDLIRRKVTSPDHLGIMGGSNGGLLMGNMLVGWPDLFEAVVCQVPLLDMWRYNKLLAGASWMGEYGDPDKPEDWAFLQRYSPYHHVRAGVTYPRVLFVTSTRDDRVHPGHARKMAARMLEQGHDVLLYENIEGGHGGAADNRQAAHMWALSWTFLREALK